MKLTDLIPEGSAKWIGIILGVGILAGILFPTVCKKSETQSDTIYVTQYVPSLPCTVYAKARAVTVEVYDTSAVDSLTKLIETQKINVQEFLKPKEQTIPFEYEHDSTLTLVGKINVQYDPIQSEFYVAMILDTAFYKVPVPPAPDCSIDFKTGGFIAMAGLITGLFLSIAL